MIASVRHYFCFLLLISFGSLQSQEVPPIENYTPDIYQAGNQNWCLSQSDNKYIYVANNDGLLEFNGTDWKLYNSSNGSIIRSVKAIKDKIYTGCYMEFGYWQHDENNVLQYTSLSDKIKDKLVEDEHFWRIIPYSDWILFQSLHQIVIYHITTDTFQVISGGNGIVFLHNTGESLLFQVPSEGIFEIENGNQQIVCNDQQLVNTRIIAIFPFQDSLLAITEANGLFSIKDGKAEKLIMPVSPLLKVSNVYSALKLKNGDLVFGTISKGVVITSPTGDMKYHLQHINGLLNNTVLSIMEDRDNNVWLGLDNGISCINIQSPIKTYYDYEGLLGTIYAASVYRDRLYVASNQGLFSKKIGSLENFVLVEGTGGQAWTLYKNDGDLLCGHNKGTFLIKGTKATLVSDLQGVWKFNEVPQNSHLLWQGSYEGLSIIGKTAAGLYKMRNKINDFTYSSRYFELYNDTTMLVSHELKGVFKVHLDTSLTKIESIEKLIKPQKGKSASLVKFNDFLLYSNREGIFSLASGDNEFLKDPLLTNIISDNGYFSGKMVVDDTGKLWFFTKSGIHYITKGKLSDAPVVKNISIPLSLRRTVGGFENITHIDNNTYLIGSKSGFFTLDLDEIQDSNYEITISGITSTDLKHNTTQKVAINGSGEFNFAYNNITFSFTVPEYEKYILTKYQYKLEGLYDYWSDWNTVAAAKFENLPYGDYKLLVRGQVGNAITQNIATYSFSIKRPWYISYPMLVTYGLTVLLAYLLMHYFYRRYYHAQQQKLVEKNRKEMELANARNEKELIKIRNEQLRKDVKNKSQELAASTMSVVRKNELLTEIKQHLQLVDDKRTVKPVLKIIEQNLDNLDNWELFKEAFNNVDREFLNKLNELHPNLSPNDIKLCTYLRLNLSSKEIAQLFNISTRSVEIKRYRLRKKMGLTHEENLVSYIIDL